MSLGKTLAHAAGAFAATPFLDYAWHAWVAHGPREDPTRAAHREHHRTAHTEGDPWSEMRENAALIGKVSLAVAAALTPLVGVRSALGISAGLASGYVAITLSHARMHQRAPSGRWEEWMWRFHFHHHYADTKVNFGLTSPIFDFAFGTAVVPDVVAIPEAALPAWWLGEHPGFRVRPRA